MTETQEADVNDRVGDQPTKVLAIAGGTRKDANKRVLAMVRRATKRACTSRAERTVRNFDLHTTKERPLFVARLPVTDEIEIISESTDKCSSAGQDHWTITRAKYRYFEDKFDTCEYLEDGFGDYGEMSQRGGWRHAKIQPC